MLTEQEFIAHLKGPLAVYGTNGGGIASDIWLRNRGLNHRLKCFLTDGPLTQTRFCGKPVYNTDYLADNPHVGVITADLDFVELHDRLRQKGLCNPFYYHASFWPYLDKDGAVPNPDFIAGFYDLADPHTATLLRVLHDLRNCRKLSRVQPHDLVKDVLRSGETYWHTPQALPEGELTIIDGGAFNGDTMRDLFRRYGARIKRYYAFEPMPHIFSKLQAAADEFKSPAKIRCFNAALFNHNGVARFHKGVPRSSRMAEKGEINVQCVSLDSLDLPIQGRACLKLDVEGAEMAALEGAAEFIKTCCPHLALCVYHKSGDIYEIPRYVQSLDSRYRFTLNGGVHTVCYANQLTVDSRGV